MTNQPTCSCNKSREPEEPLKTCGTCSNVEHETKTVRCPYRRYPMEQIKDWVGRPRYEHYAEDSACEEWKPRTTDTLKQRYQQLTEVARDMLRLLKNIEREYPRLLDPNRKPGGQIVYSMPSDEYAEQLEELGGGAMSEHIISDKCLEAIHRKCYQAGLTAQEVYTVRGVDGEEIVRCRDCMKSREKGWKCTRFTEEVYNEENEIGELVMANVRPDGFCKWGERCD